MTASAPPTSPSPPTGIGRDDARARVVCLHADDVGMCHGANVAYIELMRAGHIDCGSVMVPCPWFREIAATAAAEPGFDLGVHLTLTSEWPHYRWAPISTVSPASGLVDADGCFPRNCLALRPRLSVEAAEVELRAQIDRALAAGIDVTHLDTHMGAALVPELVETYLRLAADYALPLLLPRELATYTGVLRMGDIDPAPYADAIARLERADLPVFERFLMTPGAPSVTAEAVYHAMLTGVAGGMTFVAIHPNAPGDIESIVPPRSHWRTDEYRIFGSGAPKQWLRDAGIATTGMRALRDAWRARSAPPPRPARPAA